MGYGFEPSLRPNMVALCGCIDGHNITGRGGGGDVLTTTAAAEAEVG